MKPKRSTDQSNTELPNGLFKNKIIIGCIVVLVVVVLLFVMLKVIFKKEDVSQTNDSTIVVTKQITTKSNAETVKNKNQKLGEESPADICYEESGLSSHGFKVRKPKSRSRAKVLKILKQYAAEDEGMKQLYEERKLHKTFELNKVINNPEMLEFILNFRKVPAKAQGSISAKEKDTKYPLFVQIDKRWAYAKYGDTNLGFAGCGPTCLSMVAFALTRDDSVTPDAVAKYSYKHGHYYSGQGTSWSLFDNGGKHYDLKTRQISVDGEEMKTLLKHGWMLICSVGPGDFTGGGHFIVIYDYKNGKFKVNDPYCIYRSSKSYSYKRLANQIRAIWAYKKKGKK